MKEDPVVVHHPDSIHAKLTLDRTLSTERMLRLHGIAANISHTCFDRLINKNGSLVVA